MPTYCCYWPVRPVTLTIEARSPLAAALAYWDALGTPKESVRGETVRVCLSTRDTPDHTSNLRELGVGAVADVAFSPKPHDLSRFSDKTFLRNQQEAGWTFELLRDAYDDMDRRCASLTSGSEGLFLVSVDAFGQRRCYSRLWGGHAREFDSAPAGSELDAWCDGSGVATDLSVGAGAVVHAGGVLVERSHACGPGTNNVAELTGISLALAACTRLDLVVRLRSDSEYALGSVFNPSWKPKKNLDLVREAQALAGLRKVVPEHVRGHSGEPGNELADELAKRARRPR